LNHYFALETCISNSRMNLTCVFTGIAMLLVNAHCGVIQGEIAENCDTNLFNKCTDAFAKQLGLEKFVPRYGTLEKAISKIVKEQGQDGLQKICGYMKELKECLGNQYDSCVSVDYLQSIGSQKSDAAVIVGASRQLNYICTDAWDIVTSNFKCLISIQNGNGLEPFRVCVDNFLSAWAKDPSNECKYLKEQASCFETAIKAKCPQVAPIVCKTVKLMDEVYSNCSYEC